MSDAIRQHGGEAVGGDGTLSRAPRTRCAAHCWHSSIRSKQRQPRRHGITETLKRRSDGLESFPCFGVLCVSCSVFGSIAAEVLAMRRSLKLSLIVMAIAVDRRQRRGLRAASHSGGSLWRGRPARRPVPEPKDVFGFQPGADYKLASHEQLARLLRQARRRLRSHRRRAHRQELRRAATMIVAVISSEANLKNRARYQEIARRLSIARGVERAGGAGAREGRQGHRLDRRRPARHRSGRRAAHAGAGVVAGVVGIRRSEARARATRSSC